MLLDQITPLILTWNEDANIGRTLEKLRWAREVVVVDSGSTDKTREICSSFANVRMVVRPFDDHASQWNYGLKDSAVVSEWVLALDADFVLSDELVNEISSLKPEKHIAGFKLSFRYCVNGRPLSGSLYPPVISLYRRERTHYVQDGHTQRAIVDGAVGKLSAVVFHDDRKTLGRWLAAQDRYAQLECDLLVKRKWSELCLQDRLRKLLFVAPWLVPLYCLTVARGALDGWAGVYYALQRSVAETLLALKLIEQRLERGNDNHYPANRSAKN